MMPPDDVVLRCRPHVMREVMRVIGKKGSSPGKGRRAQRRHKTLIRLGRGSSLVTVGIAGTAAVLLVPTAASADPLGSTGEPPAVVQPAPPAQGTAQSPMVPVTPRAELPSVSGLN